MTEEISIEYCKRVWAENPFLANMIPEFLTLEKGHVIVRIPAVKELKNMYGGFHGGAAYTIADTAGGIAAFSYGRSVVTVEGNMQYPSASKDTRYVDCEATVSRAGKHLIYVQADLKDDRGQLLNSAQFVYFAVEE